MKRWIDIIAQAILGLIFLVFGLNYFLQFMPTPELPQPAGNLMGALVATGYFFPVLKAVEITSGVLLLIRRLPGLALVLLAPVVVQIFLFHLFLAPSGLPLAIVLVLLEAYLGFVVHRDRFKAVLSP